MSDTNWAVQIQSYVQQMGTTDNAVKVEVLEHLNHQVAKCLKAWRRDLNREFDKKVEGFKP